MDAPFPAACAVGGPQRERTSQVSVIDLAKRSFSLRVAGRIRRVSPVPQPSEGVALPGAAAASWRPAAAAGAGRSSAARSGCCRRSASSPSSSVNDAADAVAEAASRPTFVAVKTEEQQGWQARSLAAADPDGASRSRSSALQLRRALPTSGSLRCRRLLPCAPLKQGFEREDRRATGRSRRKTRTQGC